MSLFDGLRRNPFFRKIYRLPGIAPVYHWKLALLGAVLCGFPSRRLTVVGVTGTKGKTTVVELVTAMLETAGHRPAALNSVRMKIGEETAPNRTSNSMPGRFFIQRFLRDAVRAGCTHAVIEVTSEGVAQGRHKFIRWGIAAITNIAPEHIESHGSFEKYRDAKLSFLKHAARGGAHVLVNGDDERSRYFLEKMSEDKPALYSTADIASWPKSLFGGLPGEFNRQNTAAAAAIARRLGAPEDSCKEALRSFRGVPGRMEFVARQPFRVVVDYAHTPDSLEAAYKALRAEINEKGRLIAVLGSCGGHRDKWKRPVMGGVAARYANLIFLTNEDPYDEDPARILADIHEGISEAGVSETVVMEVLDRGEAIRQAIAAARAGDTVVMTGKGSETSIHVADGKVIEWSDRKAAEQALAAAKK